jgi:hypothetical protein
MRVVVFLADSHSILNRWKNCCCQLPNVHGVYIVRQTEIYKAEPVVPEPSSYEVEVEIAVEILKIARIDQIPVGLIQARCKMLHSETPELLSSVWNKGDLPEQWKESVIVTCYKKDDKADGIN